MLASIRGYDSSLMSKRKTISHCMRDRGVDIAELAESAGLDAKVVEAIVVGRYTASPSQRRRLADVLGVSADDIRWGQALEIEHLYGHGL